MLEDPNATLLMKEEWRNKVRNFFACKRGRSETHKGSCAPAKRRRVKTMINAYNLNNMMINATGHTLSLTDKGQNRSKGQTEQEPNRSKGQTEARAKQKQGPNRSKGPTEARAKQKQGPNRSKGKTEAKARGQTEARAKQKQGPNKTRRGQQSKC